MNEKIAEFFSKHGFKASLVCFSLMAIGVLMYLQAQHGNFLLQKIGSGIMWCSAGLYIIVRIATIASQRWSRKKIENAPQKNDEEKDDE